MTSLENVAFSAATLVSTLLLGRWQTIQAVTLIGGLDSFSATVN